MDYMSFVNAWEHDLLIRIKNAYMARKTEVSWVISSKSKAALCELLKKHGFIADYKVTSENNKSFIEIELNEVKEAFQDIPVIKFYSKPSRRWYVSYKDIKPVAAWRWISIIHTSKWLIDWASARNQKVGWELLAEIY